MPVIRGRHVKLVTGGVSDFFWKSKEAALGALRLSNARGLSSVDESFNGGRGRRDGMNPERGGGQNPPNPIPNRQLRGERDRRSEFQLESAACDGFSGGNRSFDRKRSGGRRSGGIGEDNVVKRSQSPSLEFLKKPLRNEEEEKRDGERFLDKFKFGGDQKEKVASSPTLEIPEVNGGGTDGSKLETKPEDAEEIFKKMKTNGLIPNAVAMLDGLCKDGLVQEAMKLFKLMREKGQIPEVVIYTAVVEGFCKAHKCDDAKRIFRKMQSVGVVPNAFSYKVLIQGFLRCGKVDDAVDFSLEMLEAGHSPNLVTFVGLVDVVANDRGVEEAKKVMNSLREKGYFVDEKAVRTYLDKKSPALPLVWEVVLGKKTLEGLF